MHGWIRNHAWTDHYRLGICWWFLFYSRKIFMERYIYIYIYQCTYVHNFFGKFNNVIYELINQTFFFSFLFFVLSFISMFFFLLLLLDLFHYSYILFLFILGIHLLQLIPCQKRRGRKIAISIVWEMRNGFLPKQGRAPLGHLIFPCPITAGKRTSFRSWMSQW